MNNLLGKKHTEDKIPSDILGGAERQKNKKYRLYQLNLWTGWVTT